MQGELLDRRRWRTRPESANVIFEYLGFFRDRQSSAAVGDARPITAPPERPMAWTVIAGEDRRPGLHRMSEMIYIVQLALL